MSAAIASTQLRHFFWHLRRLEPDSLLDVGCGRGDLLALCRGSGIEAYGIDRGKHNVQKATVQGLYADEGYAEKLAFSDDTFAWAVLRHVLHHTPNVKPALSEALRVARCGAVIAEPWADLSVPSQRLAHEVDHWSKAVHQALGYYHRPGLTLTEVLAALPEEPAIEITVDYFTSLEPTSADAVFDRMAEFSSRLPPRHPLKDQEEELKRRAVESDISAMGSMTVTAVLDNRPPAPTC